MSCGTEHYSPRRAIADNRVGGCGGSGKRRRFWIAAATADLAVGLGIVGINAEADPAHADPEKFVDQLWGEGLAIGQDGGLVSEGDRVPKVDERVGIHQEFTVGGEPAGIWGWSA